MILIIMGVTGSGKTTIGSLLAQKLGWKFYDADNYHSEANRKKMSQGIALTDEDRAGWLTSLQELISKNIQQETQCILACSALKNSYREVLKVNEQVKFVHLQGTPQQIKARLSQRSGHYMSPNLLDSQFDILEEPQNALTVDISNSPQDILAIIIKGFNL